MLAYARALVLLTIAAVTATHVPAKDCEELKTEIAAKLDAKGVKGYTLDIIASADVKDSMKVVGSCGGGTKKIVYTRKQP
ncbi:MAG TPA: DUF1161 domain-containing protein [Gemmatimonadaceae bacterium]|nr:DUF1161 domain-containing protein [Gemmatimonadaceae bacterium]